MKYTRKFMDKLSSAKRKEMIAVEAYTNNLQAILKREGMLDGKAGDTLELALIETLADMLVHRNPTPLSVAISLRIGLLVHSVYARIITNEIERSKF